MKRAELFAALVAATLSGATLAAGGSDAIVATSSAWNWAGFYGGLNAGGVWNRTCANWTLYHDVGGARVNDFLANCPNNSQFTYGGQLGYNFVVADNILLGLEADYNGWSTKSRNRIVQWNNPNSGPVPAGTYSFNGKGSPNGGGTVRGRFGYIVQQRWLPYVTGGFAYASGSPKTQLSYWAPGNYPNTAPDAQLNATRTLSANGWAAGAGLEYGIQSNFSVKLEYLFVQLGHGSRQPGICTPSGTAFCNAFGTQFNISSHNSAEFNLVRLGVNYNFNGL